MKDYDKNKESSYLKYCDVNNSYGWVMSQKLHVNDFKWVEHISEFNEDFIKSYNGDNDEGYFFEVDVQYPKNVHKLYNDLPFFPERMKIEKVKNLVTNLHDKTEYVTLPFPIVEEKRREWGGGVGGRCKLRFLKKISGI